MGWRYTLFTLGSLVLVLAMVRFFIFRMPESPYFLLSKGRDQDAIDVVHHIAKKSKKSVDISIERFQNIDEAYGNERPPAATIGSVGTFFSAFKGQFANLGANSIKLLFGTRKMALQTSLIIWIWASVGLAYPLYSTFLPYYLAERTKQISSASTNAEIYGSYCYIAACTIPGPIIAGYLIDWKTLGRRYTMAIATLLSGVFLYLSTTAKTTAAVTGWNCTVTIVINLFFAIQYAYTPESFPAPIRATANGLCSMIGYTCGIAAPVIANQSNINVNIPVYISGAILLVTSLTMFALPFETAQGARF